MAGGAKKRPGFGKRIVKTDTEVKKLHGIALDRQPWHWVSLKR